MLDIFEKWDLTAAANIELFAGLPAISLDYEDLEADLDGAMVKVYEFLGVDPGHRATYETKKQRFREAREMIVNFREVQEAIRDSKWADRLRAYL